MQQTLSLDHSLQCNTALCAILFVVSDIALQRITIITNYHFVNFNYISVLVMFRPTCVCFRLSYPLFQQSSHIGSSQVYFVPCIAHNTTQMTIDITSYDHRYIEPFDLNLEILSLFLPCYDAFRLLGHSHKSNNIHSRMVPIPYFAFY